MIVGKHYRPADFAHAAWRRRWLIGAPFVVGVFLTLVISSRLPDLYESEMLIQVVPQRVPDAFVQSTVTVRTEDRISALGQQVTSRAELEQMIERFDLYGARRERLPMQDVIEHMREQIELEVVSGQSGARDAEAFYVRFFYPEAETATRVVGELGSLFIDQNSRDRNAIAEGTNQFLRAQLAQARTQLEEQEQRLERFRQRHAGRLPTQLDFNMQAMQNTQLQLQAHIESLARDRDRKMMLERLYGDAQIETGPGVTPFVPWDGQAGLASGGTTEQRLAVARATLVGLEARFKPGHPDIGRVTRLIEDLEHEVAAELESAESPIALLSPEERARRERLQEMRAEIESLGRQIEFKEVEDQRMRSVIGDYEQRIEAVPGVESEWIALSRDYETQQAAYEGLLAKSEQAKVAADLERRQVGEQFRVIDPPLVPTTPASPNRIQISVGGTLASLFVGLALAGLVETRNATFQTDAEVIELLALPVVAQVPHVDSDDDLRWRRTRRWLASMTTTIALTVGGYLFWTLELWRFII